MSFFEKLLKSDGGYIFISHSHKDIEKVRTIRNELESYGFEPLCFYLKCLDENSELENLLEREIDAREWFLFANSENSKKSKWVNIERHYIERTNRKKIIAIKLNDINETEKAVEKIYRNLRVYIFNSMRDYNVAKRIHTRLREKDYLPYIAPDNMPPGMNWQYEQLEIIREASLEGCVLFLVSKNSVKSPFVEREISSAFSENSNVVPVFLGNIQDIELPLSLRFQLSTVQWYSLPENPTDDEIDEMIDRIGFNIINKN